MREGGRGRGKELGGEEECKGEGAGRERRIGGWAWSERKDGGRQVINERKDGAIGHK